MKINKLKSKFDRRRKKVNSKRLSNVNYSLTTSVGSAAAVISFQALNKTNYFNTHIGNIKEFIAAQKELNQQANQLFNGDFSFRGRGVQMGWRGEKILLEMEHGGTRNWNQQEINEIVNKNGKVSGYEGHHINNVADHPTLQAEGDNIEFLNREEHFKAHNENWSNSSDGKLINRQIEMKKMLIKSELLGFGSAVLVGAGIGFAVSLFNNQLSWTERIEFSVEGGTIGGFSYIGARVGGQIAESIFEISSESIRGLAFAGVGASIVTSIYIFIRARRRGSTTKQALKSSGSYLGVSLIGLFFSIIAKAKYGGNAGLFAGLFFAGIITGYNFYRNYKLEELFNEIQTYEIELLQPSY